MGEQKDYVCQGLFRPLDMTYPVTYSYWHPLGYGSSESIAYDRKSCRADGLFFVICLIPRCKAAIGCVEPMD